MRMNEITYTDAPPIEGYGPGFFRIRGQVVEGPVAVLPDGAKPWGGYEDPGTLTAASDRVALVFGGTGAETQHVPPAFRASLEEAGIGVEPMASPAACRTYNVLLSEGRRVGLALIPV